jgi:hypothetical protein
MSLVVLSVQAAIDHGDSFEYVGTDLVKYNLSLLLLQVPHCCGSSYYQLSHVCNEAIRHGRGDMYQRHKLGQCDLEELNH